MNLGVLWTLGSVVCMYNNWNFDCSSGVNECLFFFTGLSRRARAAVPHIPPEAAWA